MFKSKNRKLQELEKLTKLVEKEDCAERLRQWFTNSQKEPDCRKIANETTNVFKE